VAGEWGPLVENKKSKVKVDYCKILSEVDFVNYVKLRDFRKVLAEQSGVPPYVVFTNEQLADMVRGGLTTKAPLQELTKKNVLFTSPVLKVGFFIMP